MIVVLGVGNTIMQDDGIGVRAVQALGQAYTLPSSVRLIEGGVAGIRLLPYIQDADDLLIVDAVSGSGPPGTIYRLSSEEIPLARGPLMSAHEVGIAELISMADLLGKLPRTRILGIQPLEVRSIGLDLSKPLRAALPGIVAAIAGELKAMGVVAREKREWAASEIKTNRIGTRRHA